MFAFVFMKMLIMNGSWLTITFTTSIIEDDDHDEEECMVS